MVGRHISHYRLTGRLGEGGMGVVYEALDEMLGRSVALKIPSGNVASSLQLATEARAASRLNHPNIAQIYEFGETEDGCPFIAMELVRGRTLREMLAGGPLPAAETIRIVRSVAEALEEAHRLGIMHLDIKPGNIAVTERGVVKVLDFGLARSVPVTHLDPDDSRTETLSTRLQGTPSYMSPEQARGEVLDARSDLFSLGAVTYECLTGRQPFSGSSVVNVLLGVVSSNPPPPSSVTRGVPSGLDLLVQKLMAKDRADRFASATEFLKALDEATGAGSAARWPVRLAAALLLAVLVVTGLLVWRTRHSVVRQVVVLPFEDLSHQPERAAFCDGLAEIATGVLSKIGLVSGRVWVMPSNDVRRFGVHTVAEAGRALHADIAITGSAQRDAAAWVITVNASDAQRPHLLASRSIHVEDRRAADLEAELTTALAELLNVRAAPPSGPAQSSLQYARFVTARGYLRQYDRGDNLKRAVSELERIVAESPRYATAQVALSEAYYRTYLALKQPEWLARADQAVRRAGEIDENEPGVHVMLGRILNLTGQTDEAIREVRLALSRDPGDVTALLQLARAYETAGRVADAEATYLQAIRLRPSYFPAYQNLGVLYMSEGKWRQAEEPLTLVTKLAPDLADGYTTLGSLEFYLDRLDEAQRLFSRSIELKPTATAYSNRCAVEFDKRVMENAVADCRKAIELNPDGAIGWGNLADTLYERGSRHEAEGAYRKGLEVGNKMLTLNPTNPELLSSMAKFAAKTGQNRLALDLAAKALAQGNSVRVLYNAGKAYGLAGDCGRAAELLKGAIDKGFPRQDARRDPDLARLRAAPLACPIPPIG